MKLIDNLKSETIKRDARAFARIMNKYGLDLYLKDSLNILFKIEAKDNLRHLFVKHNYLDGSIIPILRKLSESFKKFDTCIDVGANFGLVSVYLSQLSDRVIAFEPEPTNLYRLKKILEANHCSNITVIPQAVSDKCGIICLFIADASSHHSLGLAHSNQNINRKMDVETTTLDKFCADNNISKISVLKIDVEGFELEVVEGARNLLSNKLIDYLIFEISIGVMDRLNRSPKAILDFLSYHKYGIYDSDGRLIDVSYNFYANGQDFVASHMDLSSIFSN